MNSTNWGVVKARLTFAAHCDWRGRYAHRVFKGLGAYMIVLFTASSIEERFPVRMMAYGGGFKWPLEVVLSGFWKPFCCITELVNLIFCSIDFHEALYCLASSPPTPKPKHSKGIKGNCKGQNRACVPFETLCIFEHNITKRIKSKWLLVLKDFNLHISYLGRASEINHAAIGSSFCIIFKF